jgi:integrase
LDYAASPDDVGFRNPAELTARFKKALPQLPKGKKPQHHSALPYAEIGAFMADLRQRDSIAGRALEFAILTATRTSETLLAQWPEFDLAGKVWTIPADRMKAGKAHRVPLSDAAVVVLAAMGAVRQSAFVFPGMKPGKPLSNMAMLAVLARLGRPDLTTHGFRSTFRDWCGERAGVPREVAEAALAHVIEDRSEAAYARGDLLERRRPVMEMWARYCSEHVGGAAVVPMRAVG